MDELCGRFEELLVEEFGLDGYEMVDDHAELLDALGDAEEAFEEVLRDERRRRQRLDDDDVY